jgi:hypothetical protein
MSDLPAKTAIPDEPEFTGGWSKPKPATGGWHEPVKEEARETGGWRVAAIPADKRPTTEGAWHQPRPEDTILPRKTRSNGETPRRPKPHAGNVWRAGGGRKRKSRRRRTPSA